MAQFSRRTFLSSSASVATACMLDMLYLEPRWLEVNTQEVAFFKTSATSPLRVLHLSDFHLSREVPLWQIKAAIDIGLSLNPDLICLTGDYVTNQLQERALYRSELERLSKFCPVFAVMGNHDGGKWKQLSYGTEATPLKIVELLKESSITVLEDSSTELSVGQNRMKIVGLKDIWSGSFSFDQAFAGIAASDSVLVLSHNPDSKEFLSKYPWQLMLCGHTHGGQFRVPFIGATPYAPVNDHRYVAGLNPWNDKAIFTTKGVGNILGLRFNCRPEVSLLVLCNQNNLT